MDLLCDSIMELITNISQANITNLNSVFVEYLMKTIIAWKMLFLPILKMFYQYWFPRSYNTVD